MADEFGDEFTFDDDEPLPVLDATPRQQQQQQKQQQQPDATASRDTATATAAQPAEHTPRASADDATAPAAAATAPADAPAPAAAQADEFGYDEFEAEPSSVDDSAVAPALALAPAPAPALAPAVAEHEPAPEPEAAPEPAPELAAAAAGGLGVRFAEPAAPEPADAGAEADAAKHEHEHEQAAPAATSSATDADEFGFDGEEDAGGQGAAATDAPTVEDAPGSGIAATPSPPLPADEAPVPDAAAAAQPTKPLAITTASLPLSHAATTIDEQLAETRRVRAADPRRVGVPVQSPFASNKHEPAVVRGWKPPPEKDLCGSCETSMVQLHCPACVRDYCRDCDGEIHRGERALRKHVRQPVTAEANRVVALQRTPASAPTVAVFAAPAADSLYNQTPLSSPAHTVTRTASIASVASDSQLSHQAMEPAAAAAATVTPADAVPSAIVAPAPAPAVVATPAAAGPEPTPAAPTATAAVASVPAESDNDDYAEDANYGEDDDFDAAPAPPAAETAASAAPSAVESAPSDASPAVASAPSDASPAAAASSAVSSSGANPVAAAVVVAASASASPPEQGDSYDEDAAEEANYFSDDGFEPEEPDAAAPPAASASADPAPAIMVTAPSSVTATPERGRSASNASVAPVPLSRSAQRIRDARAAQAAQARKANLPIASKAAPAPAGQKGIHPHEQHSFSPQLNARRKVAEEPKAVLRSTKAGAPGAPKAKSPARGSKPSGEAGAEYSESDQASDATDPEEDKSSSTVLEQLFHVLLQDPLAPSSVSPLLEGMRIPVSVLCRAGRPSSVFYSDASGFVRYHAWNAARERKGEARAKARAMQRAAREKEQAASGAAAAGVTKASCSAEAAPLLYLFHPSTAPSTSSTSTIHASGANTAASLTTAAHFLNKSIDASAIDQADVLRMFTPQLRERNLKFLRKQRHKAARMEQRKAAAAAQRAASNGLSPQHAQAQQQPEEKEEDDEYSDDNDDEQQQQQQGGSEIEAAKAAKAAAAVPLTLEQQYAEAYARSTNHRGYVNIEAWKAEERALMMARQKAAFLAAEAERAARAADERRQAIEQEKLFVALLIYTGPAQGPANTPLPPPEALTLGQLRLLFRAPVLSASETCHGWHPPAGFDFLVQKLEYAPGIDHVVYQAEFNESLPPGTGGMAVARVQNVWRPPQQDGAAPAAAAAAAASESTASRAHQGFRHAEECFTVKGPPECGGYTVEAPVRTGELVRKFKKVLVNLVKRVAEVGRQGRPCVMRAYFQEGVPTAASDGLGGAAADASPDASSISLNATNLSTGLMRPPDERKKLFYLLFADTMHLAPPRISKALGALESGQQTELHVLNAPSLGPPVAAPSAPGLQEHTSAPGSFHLFPRDDTTGETLLPGLHGYAPPMLNSNVTVDRSSCCKCHAKMASSSSANLIMLRQVLLKWLPNRLYEYPEQLFADVLGVDEDRNCANWHRATVVCCSDCIAEIRALKTIPSRTQLAPWLASVAVSAVPTASGKSRSLVPHPDVQNPQVQSGTLAVGGGVVVPAPAALPSLLPYLARAPVLHSRGPGHASQLVPAVAFVARKNTSMLEVQGMVGPSAGLGISGSSESAANAGLVAGAAPTKANNIHPSLLKNAALRNLASKSSLITSESVSASSGLTAPNLSVSSHRESNTLFRAAPTLTSAGHFVMESSYMDVSSLNPHQHPTHQPSLATTSAYASGRNLRESASVKSLPPARVPQPLRHEGGSPSRLVSKLLGHSASAGALQSAKSSIAGGAGTAPAVPHLPLAPTVIFSPVKGGGGGVAGGKTRQMQKTQAWPQQAAQTTTAQTAVLPAVKSASAGRQKQPAAAAASPVAAKPAAATGVSLPPAAHAQSSKPLSKVQPPSAAAALVDPDEEAYDDDDYGDEDDYAESFSHTQSISKQPAASISRATPSPVAAVYDAPTDRFVSPVAVPTIAAALAPAPASTVGAAPAPTAAAAPAPKGYSTATVTKAPQTRPADPAPADAYDADEQDGGYYQSHISDDAEPSTGNPTTTTAVAAPAAAAPVADDPADAYAEETYEDDF